MDPKNSAEIDSGLFQRSKTWWMAIAHTRAIIAAEYVSLQKEKTYNGSDLRYFELKK